MKIKIILIVCVFIILISIYYINPSQPIGGPVCDSDENLEDCLKNSPTYGMDGFTYGEFLPYQHYLFLIIPVSVIIIWLIVRNKLKK